MKGRLTKLLALLAVFAMLAVACGDTTSTTTSGETTSSTTSDTAAPSTTSAEVDRQPDTRDPATATRADTLIVDIDAGVPDDTSNFNPYSGGERSAGYTGVLADPLFILNLISGEMEPWLAESVTPNDDASSWTLKLREGATWNDGEALTADDILFTVEMLQTVPELSGGTKFGGVTVTTVDDVTVQFDLEAADPRFALTSFGTALPSQAFLVVPEHIWGQVDDIATFKNYAEDGSLPVVSGPYTVEKVADTRITYIRNNDWWGATTGFAQLPAPLKVEFVAFEGEEQKVAALDQGQLDWASNISAATYLTLKQQNANVAAWGDNAPFGQMDLCPRQIEFNQTAAPFGDPNVRWGIAHLINRAPIVDVGYGGFGAPPSRHFFADYAGLTRYVDLLDGAGLTEQYPFQTTDADLAAERLGAAGYTLEDGKWMEGGEQLSIEISNYDDPLINNLSAVIVEQLTAAGIDARQNVMQIPDFIDGLLGAGFEGYVFFGSCGSTVDPWSSMNAYNVSHLPEGDEPSPGFYANTFRWSTDNAVTYSGLVDQIGQLVPGDPAIDDLFVQAMELWLEELPSIPLAQHPAIHPFSSLYWQSWPTENDPYVQGFISSPALVKTLNRLNPVG